jgi:hypothetical protein
MGPTIRNTGTVTGRQAGHVPFCAYDLIIELVSFTCSAFSGFNVAIIPTVD